MLLPKKKKVSLKNFLLHIPKMAYHTKIRGSSYMTRKEDRAELDSRSQHPSYPVTPK